MNLPLINAFQEEIIKAEEAFKLVGPEKEPEKYTQFSLPDIRN